MAPYGPLYYGVIAGGVGVFGDQFWFGRGLACLALCAFFIYAIVRRWAPVSRAHPAGLIGSGLLLAQYPVQSFVGTQRPDLLALAGLALAVLDTPISRDRSVLRAVGAGTLLACAILVRQTLFLPLVVSIGWFAVRRDWSRLAAAALGALGTLTVVCGFLLVTSRGGFFWHSVRVLSSVPFSVHVARESLISFVRSPATLLTIMLLCIGLLWGLRGAREAQPDGTRPDTHVFRGLLLGYLGVAFVVALLSAAKVGSSTNYWLEVAVVLSLVTPLVWARQAEVARDGVSRSRWRGTVFRWLLAATLVGSLFTGLREAHGQLAEWRSLPYTDEVVAKLRAITTVRDPVVVDFPDLAVAAGRRYYFNDIFSYKFSPLLSPVMQRVTNAAEVKAIASLSPVAPPGYVPVCLRHHLPTAVYAVRLYTRTASPRRTAARCVTS